MSFSTLHVSGQEVHHGRSRVVTEDGHTLLYSPLGIFRAVVCPIFIVRHVSLPQIGHRVVEGHRSVAAHHRTRRRFIARRRGHQLNEVSTIDHRRVKQQFLLRSGQIVVGLDAPLVVGEEPREGLVVGHEERLATRQAQHTCVFRLAGGRIDVRHLIVVDELQHRLIIPALFQFLINTAPQPRRHTREKFVLTRN